MAYIDTISLESISNSVIEESKNSIETTRRLKKELRELGVETSLHGIPRILTRKLILFKVIWLLFFLASIGLCSYTIVTNIQQYISFGVNTLVQVVPQNSIPLPTISVCNLNPMVTQNAFDYISSYYSMNYNITVSNYTHFYEIVDNQIPNEIDWLFYQTFHPRFNRTLRNSFGFSFDEQNVWCRLFFLPCNNTEYVMFYHPKYGNCFLFNSGYSDNQQGTPIPIDIEIEVAEEYGLEMGIFTGDTHRSYLYEQSSRGIVVLIGEQNKVSLDKDGILVAPGSYANVVLSKTYSQNLPQPYNDCQDPKSIDTHLGNEMKRLNISYDRHNCFTLCKQMIIIEKLGCYDMRYPSLFNSTPCNDKTSFEKLKKIELDLNRCQNECPFECETLIYDWDISYALFPNYFTFKNINMSLNGTLRELFSNRPYSYLDVQETVAGFYIYFDPLIITEITQSPSLTLIDLIANLGGALGLFLGLSVLSIVEFMEMILISLVTIFKLKVSGNIKIRPVIKVNKRRRSEDKIGLIYDILRELKSTSQSTTLHGLPHVISDKRLYIKLIWLTCTLISVSFCLFMIIRAISNYVQYELMSQIRQVPQENLTFPSIQICSPNFFLTREANKYASEFYSKNYGINITNLDGYFEFANITYFESYNWPFYQSFSPKFNATLRRSFGYSLDDMLLKCEFDSKPCNRSWFDWYYHPLFGNCYIFNTGYLNGVPNSIELLRADRPNIGLYMELFNALPDDDYDFYLNEWQYNAINLYISYHGHLPVDKYGRPFKAGTSASINLALTHYVNLPAPYTDCQYAELISSDLVRNIRNANVTYDRYNCISYCQQILNYNASGCYLMAYPNLFNLPLCEAYDDFVKNRLSDYSTSECPIICPAECEQYSYAYEISFSDFPSRNYAQMLIRDRHDQFERLYQTKNITFDMLKKSLNSFYFYFDELAINEIIESPAIEFVDLISNIGGTLGLFVGISVLSFVELIELIINITRIVANYYHIYKS